MKKPLVSILTPFKNTEKFLNECLNSILKQSYTNWELIIVDDFSTDKSYKIVENFAKRDNRITLLKNTFPGIINALQLALTYSNGVFITRMDSDDIMRSNKLETLVNNLLKSGKQHIATGLVNYFSEEGLNDGYKAYETWLNALTKNGQNYSEIYKECVIPSPCWMVYKDDLLACDAFFPNRYPEDYDLAFRFYKYNYKCIPCHTIIHDWRDYNSRTSRTDKHYAENHFLELKLDYFLELDYDPKKKLIIWGAGLKGKKAAKLFIERGVPFEWVCDNPNKIGHNIYGKKLQSFDILKTIENLQSIITVANKKEQNDIKIYFEKLGMKATTDYIFFC